jgi:transglutaminase-like putative cysteine protease
MPVFKIHHITRYEYDRPVKENVNEIKIYPYLCPEQETLQHDLLITGSPEIQTFFDYWGNKTGTFNLLFPHDTLVIESMLVVRTTATGQLRINFHSGWQQLEDEVRNNLNLLEYTGKEPVLQQDTIDKISQSIYSSGKSVASAVEYCSEYIFKNFEYIKGITNIETTVDEILEHKAGVCQDFAHLMLQVLRSLNIPSRYVSGYICPHKSGMRGEGATHAWVEAWIPGFGWAGIDPTNNIWVTNTHVKLAVGRNFNDCSPVKGVFKGPAKQKLSVYVSIGYESGYMFEEINNVRLIEEPSLYPGEIPAQPASQQQ